MTFTKKARGAVLIGIAAIACTAATSSVSTSSAPAAAAPELRVAMRKLWSDHVIWTRQYIAFDGIFSQAMMMADALTDGIAKQYPTKVS